MNDILKKYSWLTNRWILVYLIAGMLLCIFVDHSAIKLKTLNHFRNSARELNTAALKNLDVDEKTLYETIQYSKRIVNYNSNLHMSYSVLGYAYYQMNEIKSAIVYYRKAIEHYPELYGLHYNLGMLLILNGQWDKGVDILQSALSIAPDKSIAYHRRVATRMFKSNNHAQAWVMGKIQELKKAHVLSSNIVTAYENFSDAPSQLREQQNLAKEYLKLYYYVPLYEVGVVPLSAINKENIKQFQ